MAKEREQAAEDSLESLKAQVFASAFGAFDPKYALGEYYKTFEHQEDDDYEVEEYVPEDKGDVLEMLNAARRAGAIK